MAISIDLLTKDVFEEFGNRKKPGRLSLLTKVDGMVVYPVPIGPEHIDFFIELVGSDDSEKMTGYIPTHIDRFPTPDWSGDVTRVITGVCGMEITYGARHDIRDLHVVHDFVKELIEKSGLVMNLEEDTVVKRYSFN